LGCLVNRHTNKCLEAGVDGNLWDKAFNWSCHDGLHQRWEKTLQNKHLNKAYTMYLGVAYCGNTSKTRWLELTELSIEGEWSNSQIWF